MVRYIRLQQLQQCVMVVMLVYLFGAEGGRQTLTFMTIQKTWNEARTICEMNGGYLLKDSTAKTTADVFDRGVMEPWVSQAFLSSHFWIGLFCTGIIVNGTNGTGECIFAWSDDCSNLTAYSDWHPSEPIVPASNQCVYRKQIGIHQNWHSSLCSKTKYYICQNEDGIPCDEETMVGVRGKAIADQTYTTIVFSVCRANCENMTCTAYAYNPASGTCYLYIDFSVSYFNISTNLQEDSGYTLYIRQCYNIAIDDNLYTNISNNDTGVTDNCMEPVTMTSLPTTVTTTTKQCQCLCTLSNISMSAGQLQQKITTLQSQLSVHKSSLSSTRRKLTSAHDDRKSSAGLGYIAVLFLILVVGVMVLSDLSNVFVALNIWTKPKQTETYAIEL